MTDFDQIDLMRRAITALGLGQVAPEELVAEARASSSRREEARRLLSDANVRMKDLESALRDLGVNPGGDLPGEVRAITNRTAANEAAAQHDLDCALRERDRAIGDAQTAAARVKDLEAKIASNVAEAAARDMRIADLERDLAAKDASLKTAHAALKRICEIVGAPIPVCPEDVVEAVAKQLGDDNDANARAAQAEEALKEIAHALDDYSLPTHYGNHPEGARLGIAERASIGLMVLWTKWNEAHQKANQSESRLEQIEMVEHYHAHKTLDALGAPRLAGGFDLDLAARIRALPR